MLTLARASHEPSLANDYELPYQCCFGTPARRRSYVEGGLESLRAKLLSLSGVPIDSDAVLALLAEIVNAGGGVHVEVDDGNRFKLIRREGKFVITKDSSRTRPSSFPPRR
jgi:hypothetical protein